MCELFNILPWKENEFHSCKAERCLRISYSAGFLFSLFSLPPIQFPDRCHLFGCSDIRKILTPRLYRPCMLLKHRVATGSSWSPPTPNFRQNLWNPRSRLVCPGLCRPPAPALSSSGHLQAPWYCTLTLQQPARSAADCRLTGDVLASRGPSRWVPRHCRGAHSLLASKQERGKGVKTKSVP